MTQPIRVDIDIDEGAGISVHNTLPGRAVVKIEQPAGKLCLFGTPDNLCELLYRLVAAVESYFDKGAEAA